MPQPQAPPSPPGSAIFRRQQVWRHPCQAPRVPTRATVPLCHAAWVPHGPPTVLRQRTDEHGRFRKKLARKEKGPSGCVDGPESAAPSDDGSGERHDPPVVRAPHPTARPAVGGERREVSAADSRRTNIVSGR